jgi:hypothetical protein
MDNETGFSGKQRKTRRGMTVRLLAATGVGGAILTAILAGTANAATQNLVLTDINRGAVSARVTIGGSTTCVESLTSGQDKNTGLSVNTDDFVEVREFTGANCSWDESINGSYFNGGRRVPELTTPDFRFSLSDAF